MGLNIKSGYEIWIIIFSCVCACFEVSVFWKTFRYLFAHKRTEEIINEPQIKVKRGGLCEPVCVRVGLEMETIINSDFVLQALCDIPCRYDLHLLFCFFP